MYIILVSVVNDRDESKNGVAPEESWRGRTETINYDVIIVAGAFRKLPNASAIKTHRVQSEPENCSLTSGSIARRGAFVSWTDRSTASAFFPHYYYYFSTPIARSPFILYYFFFYAHVSLSSGPCLPVLRFFAVYLLVRRIVLVL